MKIYHNQLTFAREFRGYSQTDLSNRIDGLSQPNLSKFEQGLDTLSNDLLEKIMDFLRFPMGFLSKNISNESPSVHYRKKSTISKSEKNTFDRNYQLVGDLIEEMSRSLDWPQFSLKALDLEEGYTPEYVANHTRKLLGYKPNEPIRNIVHNMESHGIIVVELDLSDKFDGVSYVTDNGFPVIVIGKSFSNDRKRFTIAHELGHLLMHSINTPAIPNHRLKQLEKEANLFAAEFLMPKDQIMNSLFDLKLSHLAELKNYWLTSMASILYRSRELRCISEETYKYLNIEFSRKGLKRNEGIDVHIDSPNLFRKCLKMHKEELGYTDEDLSKGFNIPLDFIREHLSSNNQFTTRLRVVI